MPKVLRLSQLLRRLSEDDHKLLIREQFYLTFRKRVLHGNSPLLT